MREYTFNYVISNLSSTLERYLNLISLFIINNYIKLILMYSKIAS